MQKSVLITGCSSGIGLAAARALKAKDYQVFATARKMTDVDKLNAEGLVSLQLDVNDTESMKTALAAILEKTNGTLYGLFNNAGFAIPGAVEDITRDMMREQFESNVFGPMELTNLVLPIMHKQGYGRIIQNTSILGIITMPFRGVYNASKFALEGFSCTLRQELDGTNIKVSCIAPGAIDSDFRANAFKSYQSTLQNTESAYKPIYKQMEKYFYNPEAGRRPLTASPVAVIKKLIHALESNNPKAHYYIGLPANVFAFLKRILPDNSMDWLIQKIIREETK